MEHKQRMKMTESMGKEFDDRGVSLPACTGCPELNHTDVDGWPHLSDRHRPSDVVEMTG